MVSRDQDLQSVAKTLKDYEAVTGASINRDKSVDLHLGTLRGKSMPSNIRKTVR